MFFWHDMIMRFILFNILLKSFIIDQFVHKDIVEWKKNHLKGLFFYINKSAIKDFCHWILYVHIYIEYVSVWQFYPYLFVRSFFINWLNRRHVLSNYTNYTPIVGQFQCWKEWNNNNNNNNNSTRGSSRKKYQNNSEKTRYTMISWSCYDTRPCACFLLRTHGWTFTIWLPCRFFLIVLVFSMCTVCAHCTVSIHGEWNE